MVMTGKEILSRWLKGTTCGSSTVKREVLFENDTHIILKHGSHSEYIDRFAGSGSCRVYAILLDKREVDLRSITTSFGFEPMKKWEGRLNINMILLDCKRMGVLFHPEDKGMR